MAPTLHIRRIVFALTLVFALVMLLGQATQALSVPIRDMRIAQNDASGVVVTATLMSPPNAKYCHVLARAVVGTSVNGQVRVVKSFGTHRFTGSCSAGWSAIPIQISLPTGSLAPGKYALCLRAWTILRGGGKSFHTRCVLFQQRF